MKFNKIFLPIVAAASLLNAACTEEVEYTPAEPSPLAEYYFTTTNSDTQELLDGTTSFSVTIARADSNGEKTVAIESSIDPAGAFSIPESVTFEDGEAVKNLRVGYDLNNIEVNTHYTLTLSIPGVEDTPYSYGKLTIDIVYLPWPTVVGENGEQFGLYREGFYYGLFTALELLQYEVTIQQHPTTEGIYRIVNPYSPDKCTYVMDFFGGYDSDNDYYMIINASDPDHVYIETSLSGIFLDGDPDYPLYLSSVAGNTIAGGGAPDPAVYGTLKDGIITMPARSLINFMDIGDGFGGYYGNIEGTFRVVLPGYEAPTEWVSLGMCEFTDGFYGKYLLGDDYQPVPYKVEVEQFMQEEGQFRIVNPYSVYGEAAEGGDEYFYIDAANNDCVMWTYKTGKTVGTSTVYCGTYGDYLLANNKATIEEIEETESAGFFIDNVFTVKGDKAGVYTISAGRPMWRASNIDVKLDISNPEEVVEGDAEAKRFNGKRTMTKNAVKTNIQLAR